MTRKIMISNVFGTINRGDALLVESLMEELKSVFPKDVEYYGVANRPDLQAAHIPEVNWTQQPGRSDASSKILRRVENAVYSIGTILSVLLGAPKAFPSIILPKSQQKSLENIKQADLVISCPGGFLVEDSFSVLVSLLQLWAAKHFGRKLIFAPQTIGPIRNKLVRKLCGYVLRKADLIIVREDYSLDFVINELGVSPDRVTRGMDMALSHKQSDPDAGKDVIKSYGFEEGEKFLGGSVIQWIFPKSEDPQKAQREYERKLAEVYTRVYEELGLKTLVFNQVTADLEAAKRVRDMAGDFVIIDEEDRDVSVMRSMIGQSHVFLGSRLHSCIFSLLEHVPATALAYNYKTDGIMNDVGQSHRVWKIESFKPDEVVESIKYDHENREKRAKEVKEGLEKAGNSVFRQCIEHVFE